jgi:tRNA A-37 threonylcarbamoyl transferase component Bud32
MQKKIAAIRRRVVSKYVDYKVFRECTDIKVTRTRGQFQAISRPYGSSLLGHALANLDPLLEAAQSQRLKSGNTCTVALAEIDNRKVVVKRYNVKNFWHGLGRALRQSRAAISWSNAHRLQMHEIATASPVALVERRYGFIRRQAYFVAEYIDAPDIHDFFAKADVDETQKRIVANNVAQLFYKLNLLKISHGDFKATNVKVVGDQPLLIDLDSMRQHKWRWLFERSHLRDLRRFLRNWQQAPQTRMLLTDAFAKFYKDQRLLNRAGWV